MDIQDLDIEPGVDVQVWTLVGYVRVAIESAGDTDAVIEHCRKIFGVPDIAHL